MADSVQFSVSCTPVEELATENSGTANIIASEVNKSLGGSGSATVSAYNGSAANQGYLNATVNYFEGQDSNDTTDLSSESSATFIFIKNTGYTFSSATALGAKLDKALKIMVASTPISILDPGEAIILKDDNAGLDARLHVRTVDLDGGDNASAGHLAIEYLIVD